MLTDYSYLLELLPLFFLSGGFALLALIYFTAQH